MWFIYLIYPVGLFALALFVILSKYFYNILSKNSQILEINSSSKTKFYFYSAINLIVVIVWILFAVESSPLKNRISDYGAPYGGLSLLIIISVSLVISTFINTKKANNNLEYYRYIALSKLFWLISLIPGIIVVLFYGLYMFSDR
ncbi:MAG: hypothetical protein GWN56_17740 [Nitrosopumilaceae archaeon]|nr:hypothetical protein [Nitrosopumilaceae archaeon]